MLEVGRGKDAQNSNIKQQFIKIMSCIRKSKTADRLQSLEIICSTYSLTTCSTYSLTTCSTYSLISCSPYSSTSFTYTQLELTSCPAHN